MSLPLAAFELHAPTGPAWEFLVLFAVVIIGPPMMERARVPGIIGLLIGGFVIGPNGLNVIASGNTTVPELGQVGLLYLMFVAGVELDLSLLRVYRRAVGLVGTITFLFPMALGVGLGFLLGWNVPASLLLGSLMASHTLLTYPSVRRVGLAAHPAVATVVGATVITDTAALVVLAVVSGTQVAGGTVASIAIQVVVGLIALALFALVVLPRIVRLGFRYLGSDRVVRYLLAVASFLGAAALAGVLGIEPIVGAFFAGLGLNRLVPNEGPLMDRIDFFGSAVFVPVFLVSVGMLLQPSVMIELGTLKLAGLFILVVLLGKGSAVLVTRRALRLNFAETTLVMGLTVPQAAATLAATVVGYDIGLFGQQVVNAVLVLILASILIATVLVERSKHRVSVPRRSNEPVGRRILVALDDPRQAFAEFTIASRIATADGGVVRALLSSSRTQTRERHDLLEGLTATGYEVGIDVDPRLLVHSSLAEGIIDAASEQQPSLVLVGQRSVSSHPTLGGTAEAVAAAITTPVAVIVGDVQRIDQVVLAEAQWPNRGVVRSAAYAGAVELATALAARIAGKRVRTQASDADRFLEGVAPGQLWIAAADSWLLHAALDPPPGAALMLILDSPALAGESFTDPVPDEAAGAPRSGSEPEFQPPPEAPAQ